MDWTLIWTAVGAIGGTLGALATSIAVIVALWQTKYSQKKKIKVCFTDLITLTSNLPSDNVRVEYVGIDVTNIGNRDVIIQSWGFVLQPKSNGKVLILPDRTLYGELVRIELPKRLALEESITLVYAKELFQNVLIDNCSVGKLNSKKKLQFYVCDSTGKYYYAKTQKKIESYLPKKK